MKSDIEVKYEYRVEAQHSDTAYNLEHGLAGRWYIGSDTGNEPYTNLPDAIAKAEEVGLSGTLARVRRICTETSTAFETKYHL